MLPSALRGRRRVRRAQGDTDCDYHSAHGSPHLSRRRCLRCYKRSTWSWRRSPGDQIRHRQKGNHRTRRSLGSINPRHRCRCQHNLRQEAWVRLKGKVGCRFGTGAVAGVGARATRCCTVMVCESDPDPPCDGVNPINVGSTRIANQGKRQSGKGESFISWGRRL